LTITVNDYAAEPNLPSTLNGTITTNTSNADQVMLVTFADLTDDFRDAFSAVILRDSQGGQGALVEDAGFDIDETNNFLVSVENSLPISKVIITDFHLEGVTILPPGGGGAGNNIQLEYDSGSGADYALVSTINPSGPSPVVGTYSIDGGSGDDILDDDGAGTISYLYGNAGDDTLNGSGDRDILNGNNGADTLLGNDGDDILVFDRNDDSIDGGGDNDILRIDDGAHYNTVGAVNGITDNIVDLTAATVEIKNIEAILLTEEADANGDGTELRLTAADVLSMTDDDNELYIIGSTGDVVNLTDGLSNWTAGATVTSSGGQTFTTYTSGTATLFVDDDITVTGTP
jgi:hypothetical protein